MGLSALQPGAIPARKNGDVGADKPRERLLLRSAVRPRSSLPVSGSADRSATIRQHARVGISADVERLLLARSGGFCANPTCRGDLFPEVPGGHVATIKELAHIISQSPEGPRGDDALPPSERDTYDNILLLCSSCHTLVDKSKLTDTYDAELLRAWKRDQERRIREAVEVPHLESREELFRRVRGLLRENYTWWREYGPDKLADGHPMSEAANTWLTGARRVLIPNNWQIVRLLERNREYLSELELEVAERFKLHADLFASRHLAGEHDPTAPRFPAEMNEIFALRDDA